jgi:glutamyl-tRNA synthetase
MAEIFSITEAAQQFGFERVNKAGAKFDWDKLNWINSQYLHHMPLDRLTDLLIPYWQEASYPFDPQSDRPWLEQVTTLIQASLTRLDDAVAMTRYLFVVDVGFTEAATTQLQQEGTAIALQGILKGLEDTSSFNSEAAQALVQQVVSTEKLKKGLVMRSLRAALTGDMHGPDLVQSWLLLHHHQVDQQRLQQAIAIAQ